MKKLSYFILCVLLLFSVMAFGGCQSTDESEQYMNTNIASSAEFTYDRLNNETTVRWYTTFTNDTIYNLIEEKVKFILYKGDVQVETKTVTYSREIKHGTTCSGWFSFVVDGEVDGIEYVAWYGTSASLWNTYFGWFIGAIVCVCIGIVAYIILMVAMDIELDAILGILGVIYIILIGCAYFIENWVSTVIVIGALVVFSILALLATALFG